MDDSLSVAAAYFLGPRSENEDWAWRSLDQIVDAWLSWREAVFAQDPAAITPARMGSPQVLTRRRDLDARLADLLERLRGELPAHSPRYVGHMLSDVALPALFGHFATLLHNPNNTSPEASRVGLELEAEAIGLLAQMIGFDPAAARGHFTSGGTVANLEAVWRARFRMDHRLALALVGAEAQGTGFDLFEAAHMPQATFRRALEGADEAAMRACSAVLGNPFELAERLGRRAGRPYRGPVVLAPGHKHYSWVKAANLFGIGEEAFWPVALDREGRLDPSALCARIDEARAAGRPILAVVSVAGTTELGEIDPIDAVADELDRRSATEGVEIWHHVDAAYGGFFCALDPEELLLEPARRRALAAMRRAHSVTIDPHKLGYTPYACGALVARDADCDAVSSFAAPYIDRAELSQAPWAHTLEGSRPATGAAATWMMARTLGFGPEGMGALLRGTIESCRAIRTALAEGVPLLRPLDPTDTNIFCFSIAPAGASLSEANARTRAVHHEMSLSPHFSMTRTVLGAQASRGLIESHVASWGGACDADHLVLMRCVVMNPFWSDQTVRARLIPQLVDELRSIVARTEPKRAAAQPAA